MSHFMSNYDYGLEILGWREQWKARSKQKNLSPRGVVEDGDDERTRERKQVFQLAAGTGAVLPLEAVAVSVLGRHPQNVQGLLEHGVKHKEQRVLRADTPDHTAHRRRLAAKSDDVAEQQHGGVVV